ncbi:MAG: TetR/AcrR family transcriptional regulator [Clostridiales bacterium]|nr:TetR/AcrR family transcriptional regulator [Clostridiales bacterium]
MLKGDLRKQAILDTAENLFFEKGYAAATIQDILDALNCSKGSFYHHFESKLQVLTELCRQRAEAGYAEFKKQTYDDGLGYLNGLIYYAMPFRAGEDKNLSLLLPLQGLADGNVVLNAILEAQKKLFFPEISKTLEILKKQGQVYYTQPMLPEILWDTYTALYQRLMQEAAQIQEGSGTVGVIQLIETERFIWERLLDAPFGSMELIRGDEALQVIGHAVSRLRRMEGKKA